MCGAAGLRRVGAREQPSKNGAGLRPSWVLPMENRTEELQAIQHVCLINLFIYLSLKPSEVAN